MKVYIQGAYCCEQGMCDGHDVETTPTVVMTPKPTAEQLEAILGHSRYAEIYRRGEIGAYYEATTSREADAVCVAWSYQSKRNGPQTQADYVEFEAIRHVALMGWDSAMEESKAEAFINLKAENGAA